MSQDQSIPSTPAGEESTEEVQHLQLEDEANTEEYRNQLKTKKIHLKWRCI